MKSDYDHINRLKIKEDITAKRLFLDDWSYDGDNVNTMNYTRITLKCTGSGNCLYNAISILLSGYENLHCELRLKCTQELIKNRFYTTRTTLMTILLLMYIHTKKIY